VDAFPDRASALRLITAVTVTVRWGERKYLDVAVLELVLPTAATMAATSFFSFYPGFGT
jgi:hypothetical protein